jgi:putative hemolysin
MGRSESSFIARHGLSWLALLALSDKANDLLEVTRMAARGRRGARVAKLRADSNRFLAAVQVGVTLAGFFSTAYGGSTLTSPLATLLTGWGLADGLADTVALVVVTAAISYLSLVLGELVPKRLALQRAEGVSQFVAPVLDRIASLFRPVIWLLSRSTNIVVRLLGLDPHAGGEQVTEDELRDLVVTNEQLTAENGGCCATCSQRPTASSARSCCRVPRSTSSRPTHHLPGPLVTS